MSSVIAFIVTHKLVIISVLYVVLNEVSAFVPKLQNNGFMISVIEILKGLGAEYPAKKNE